MTSADLNWYGDKVLAAIQAKAQERLERATVYFWEQVVKALNVGNPAPHRNPAPPGSPPRKRTGILQRNVLYEIGQGKSKVGITRLALYGVYLEGGTSKMKARPFMMATLDAHRDKIREILKGK